MKAAPLLVAWHDDNTPVYSAHFELHGRSRLATGGGDGNVRVSWICTKERANIGLKSLIVVESRHKWRNSEGDLSFDAQKTFTSCQCRQMVS